MIQNYVELLLSTLANPSLGLQLCSGWLVNCFSGKLKNTVSQSCVPKSEIANDGIKITEPCHDGFHLIDFEFNMCGGDTKCPEDIVV